MKPDFNFSDHGSICLLTALTAEARQWAEDHLPGERLEHAGATVIEPRYVAPIIEGISDAGLTIRGLL
jgi:hypothetical protein